MSGPVWVVIAALCSHFSAMTGSVTWLVTLPVTVRPSVPAMTDIDMGGLAPRSETLGRWHGEWERWAAGGDAAAGLQRWAGDPVLGRHTASVESLLDACGRDRAVPGRVADVRLAALLSYATAGDFAATRIVLERVVPALVSRAARWAKAGFEGGFPAAFGELTANAWGVIRAFPLADRPLNIAVNIIRDAEYRTGGYVPAAVRRSTCWAVPPEMAAGMSGRPDGELDTVGLLMALAGDGLAAGASPVAVRTWLALAVGYSVRELAARDGVSQRKVRNRRDAGTAAMTAAAARRDLVG